MVKSFGESKNIKLWFEIGFVAWLVPKLLLAIVSRFRLNTFVFCWLICTFASGKRVFFVSWFIKPRRDVLPPPKRKYH